MTVADFIGQYALVLLGVLVAAHRDVWPLLFNGNVERVIRAEEREQDAFEAKIVLARMNDRRVA